jgi:hypothetical protein
MELTYGSERLFSACEYAIGSTETPQKRLAAIVSSDIMYLRREHLPSDEAWARIKKIVQATTCKPAKGDEGLIAATTSQMTTDEAAEWLREIMAVHNEVAEAYGQQQVALRA